MKCDTGVDNEKVELSDRANASKINKLQVGSVSYVGESILDGFYASIRPSLNCLIHFYKRFQRNLNLPGPKGGPV